MKQIKTIFTPLEQAKHFDEDVNDALADGWVITKREILLTGTPYREPMLYAELEMEVITEAERNCENCFHAGKSPDEEPCFNCSEDCDKWEAAW